MISKSMRTIQIVSNFGRTIILIASAGIGVHMIVLLLDYYIVRKPLYLNLEKDFVGTAFSFPMIPIIGAYILLTIITYYMWYKMKNAIIRARDIEIRTEKEKIVVESTQRIAGLLANYITRHNTEIIKWIQMRRLNRKDVPLIIDQASKNISIALETLSEIAFVAPYSGGYPADVEKVKDIDDIERLLKNRLQYTGEKNIRSGILDEEK
jgi:hypothetical protein